MKSFILLLIVLLLSIFCASCEKDADTDTVPTETTVIVGTYPDAEAHVLTDGEVELTISPDSNEMQYSQLVRTNSTKIIVYAEDIPENAEVNVYIFRDKTLKEYFSTATISAKKLEAYFGAFSYLETFTIGVSSRNLEEELVVTISD